MKVIRGANSVEHRHASSRLGERTGQRFEESTMRTVFFDHERPGVPGEPIEQRPERFDGVDREHRWCQSGLSEPLRGLQRLARDRAAREQRHVAAGAQRRRHAQRDPGVRARQHRIVRAPQSQIQRPALGHRRRDGRGRLARIAGRDDRHARQAPHEADVVHAMMRGAVIAVPT